MSIYHCAGIAGCVRLPRVWRNGVGLCERCANEQWGVALAPKSENLRDRAVSLMARLQALRDEFPYALLYAEQEPSGHDADARIEPARVLENEFQNMPQTEMFYVNGLPSEYPF